MLRIAKFGVVAVLALLQAAAAHMNNRPIIGIYAQPHQSSLCPNGESCQYIAASYVKFVESHGGRAVPVPYYADNATIDHLFGSLNGVLFPGGGAAVPTGAYRMYDNAVAANRNGDHFPLWGTCMGFQWLLQLAGATLDGGFDSENVSLPLDMTFAAASSKLFNSLDPSLYAMLQDANHTSAFNNHGYGITPAHFATVASLAKTFTVLSTSADRNGKEFVSTMEAPDFPFYGVQWHPEKNVWELGETAAGAPYEAIPHGPDAVSTTLYLADFLTAEARKSAHRFADPAEEQAALIWNYPVFYTQPEFVQEYIYDF